ncbi:MAG: PEP-CTERM sorting domain-containing protein, partial [Gemmatimonadaceae bacterium]
FLNPSVSAFALVLRSISSPDGALNVVGAGGSDYPGGGFFTVNDDKSLSPAIDGTGDAAFSATLTASVVPEPATLVLLGAGLLLVGVVARQRNHRV